MSAEDAHAPVSFAVYDGEQLVRRSTFRQRSVTVGRIQKADLCLEDPSLSRMHAVVEVDPTGGRVIDLGSASGVRLNDQPVTRAPLQTGDVLTLGRFRVVLAFGDDVSDAPDVRPPADVEPPFGVGPEAVGRSSTDAPTPGAGAHASEPPEPDSAPVQHIGLRAVRPGTALVVCSRSGEVLAVRTSGHALAWPLLRTMSELDLTPFAVHAHASGDSAARTADGLRVDVTLRLTLRPRCDDAVALGIVRTFGLPPRPSQVATEVVKALTPALAGRLAKVPLAALRPMTTLALGSESALGFDLERIEVLHVGDSVPEAAGYRGGAVEPNGVRFEGRAVARPAKVVPRARPPLAALTWAEADTSQRVILGWFILLGALPLAALMAPAVQAGHGWLAGGLFLLGLCALANTLASLRSWWPAPPAMLSVVSCVSASNVLAHPLVSPANADHTTFSSIVGMLLTVCGVWFAAVVLFASNPPTGRRPP